MTNSCTQITVEKTQTESIDYLQGFIAGVKGNGEGESGVAVGWGRGLKGGATWLGLPGQGGGESRCVVDSRRWLKNGWWLEDWQPGKRGR